MSEILTPEQVQECSDYYFVSPLARSHEALRAERDRLAAEVERLRAATTWQPIDTAPKDGTLVLLYPSRCWVVECDRGEVGYWDEFLGMWEGEGPLAEDYDGPTHWMPLPAPPQAGER